MRPIERTDEKDRELEHQHNLMLERLRGTPEGKAIERVQRKERREKRIASRTVLLEDLPEEPQVPDPALAWEAMDEYRSLVRELEAKAAAVIDAMFRLGMKRREVALMLGMSEGRVKWLREKAINFLRGKMA